MVEKRLILEPEVQEIFNCIDAKQNFLLSGGAGSGKTYSLIQVIKQVLAENSRERVACITFTNAAVRQINERITHSNLSVSTIHDFLWDNIKHFQKELKTSLVALANDTEIQKIKISESDIIPEDFFNKCEKGIQYKEYLKLGEGIISHDELLILANHLFAKYPKLCDIVKDKFGFIFIDEYQDTNKMVVGILLDHFKQSIKRNIIGFFGDAMQSIYDGSIGNLDEYKGEDASKVKEIKKEQNRRNPRSVIELANRLRTDGIIQIPSTDSGAPNMAIAGEIKEGTVKFFYSITPDIEQIRTYLTTHHGWSFSDSSETRELNLTHNLIADKAGFRNLMDIYDKDPVIGLKNDIQEKIKYNRKNNKPEIVINDTDTFDEVVDKFELKNRQKQLKKTILLQDPFFSTLYGQLKDELYINVKKIYLDKDSLIDDKKQSASDSNKPNSNRDSLIKHLFKIQDNITLYRNNKYNEFLKVTDFKIKNIEDKISLQRHVNKLMDVGEKTVEEIITLANSSGICITDDRLDDFKIKYEYVYNRVKLIKFSEFQKLYEYLEGNTPFSTQHKVKGDEFNNVLVILDNGNWNDYNFENLFLGSGTASVLSRTQKIFYVCCTRSKENLAVFFHNPSSTLVSKAKEWFGDGNVISVP